MFLVQNWWCNKQFAQISKSYLLGCLPIVYFVHTTQTEIQNQYRLVLQLCMGAMLKVAESTLRILTPRVCH